MGWLIQAKPVGNIRIGPVDRPAQMIHQFDQIRQVERLSQYGRGGDAFDGGMFGSFSGGIRTNFKSGQMLLEVEGQLAQAAVG